jgi:predicted component of type VI protein secretion system
MQMKINLVGFDYTDPSEVREINRNLYALLSTPAGTCAGDRSYGLDQDFVSLPAPQAANLLALELAEKIESYEPRVRFVEAECSTNSNGTLVAVIHVRPSRQEDLDG